jgi:hypothetical protein
MAWLALDSTDTEAVATALGLEEARTATWAEGIVAASQSSIFVTPPLADWTLAAGNPLFPPARVEAFVKPLLEQLSRQFRDVQYFCTHGDIKLHLWARARQGRLVRGFAWLGKYDMTLWGEGKPTQEERTLGFQFHDESPNEAAVMQVASLWSIDPMTLDEEYKEPEMGILGRLAPRRTSSE